VPTSARSGRRSALRLGVGAIGLWALLATVGLVLTRVVSPDGPPSWDLGVDTWLEAHRTPGLNLATQLGSGVANTQVALGVTVLVVAALRWRLHRWHEAGVVVAAITGELLVFLAVTATVHRDRPPVAHLDAAPPTSSFPSGHTAAALALYGCVAVVLLVVWPGARSRVLATALFALPVVVGMSRLYRGMHYPSDVLFGAIGGGLWLLIVTTTFLPRNGPARPHPVAKVSDDHRPDRAAGASR